MRLKKAGITGLTAAMLMGTVPAYAADVPLSKINISSVTDTQVMTLKGDGSQPAEAPVDTKISREKALELAKQYVEIGSDYKLDNVSYQSGAYSSAGRRGTWQLSFSKQATDRTYGHTQVEVDADSGELVSFYQSSSEDNQPAFPPKVSLEQAKEIAQSFIANMNPGRKDQLKYDDQYEKQFRMPLGGTVQYPIRYVRVVNGVPFDGNAIHLQINSDGKITSYSQSWDTALTFTAPGKVLSSEEAAIRLQEQADLRLQYTLPYNPSGEKAVTLLTYEMDALTLDAVTGDALLWNGQKPAAGDKWLPVSEKPLEQSPEAPLNLTKDAAVKKVTSVVELPADAKLEHASYRENTDPRTGKQSTQWDFNWSSESAGKLGSPTRSATVDSATGAVIRYSKHDYRVFEQTVKPEESGSLLTDEQLRSKAIDLVKKLTPGSAHEFYYLNNVEPQAGNPPVQSFSFRRMVQGVFVEYDNINVTLDRKTGELFDFNSNVTNVDYPAELPQTISEAAAREKLLSQYKLELQYITVHKDGQYGGMPIEKYRAMDAAGIVPPTADQVEPPQTKLAYVLKPVFNVRVPLLLDAVSGEWKNRETGQTVDPFAAPPGDIKGHWAEGALQLMLDYQALTVKDGKVNPDQAITRGEMVKMLLLSLNGGYDSFGGAMYAERPASFSDVAKDSPYFAYVEGAADRNLIDRTGEFRPDETLTRSELAGLIVRAMGYSKLAAKPGLFSTAASDIEGVSNPGDIALVNALNIMTLDGTSFYPEQTLTRAGAAAAFYKFLQARADLQDTPSMYLR